MKNLLLVIISIIISLSLNAQNVGQKGNTLKNYIDINGNKQGFWQKKYYNGEIKYEGIFKNNKPVGELKRYNDKGELVSIQYFSENNNKSKFISYNKGKLESSGFFYNKEKDSVWNYYEHDSVLILQENYYRGKKNGLTTYYYTNGSICEKINWKNGAKDGINNKYFENGKVRMQMSYKNGMCDGKFVAYNDSASVTVRGAYKNDLRQGKWVFYDEKGQVKEKVNYNNGIADKQDELDKKETKKLNELEKNKNKFKEPKDQLDDMYNN